MDKREKRTQRDYTLAFKLAVVDEVEKGERTYKQAQRRYGNALEQVYRLQAKAERLQAENNLLSEQFVTWAINAECKGVTMGMLNAPLRG